MGTKRAELDAMRAVIEKQAEIITLQASQINNLIALGQNVHDRLLFLESEVRTLCAD